MPAFDYALVQAVRVATGDAVTVGAVLQCRQSRFLEVRWVDADVSRLGLDADLLARARAAFHAVAQGGDGAGPVGRLPPSERFHFLTAVRSTALQASTVRTGITEAPAAALDRIAAQIGPILLSPAGTRGATPGV